jgi:hypothetical protein
VQKALDEGGPDPSERVKNPNLLSVTATQVFVKAIVHEFSGESGNPRHPPVKWIDAIAGKGRVPKAVA